MKECRIDRFRRIPELLENVKHPYLIGQRDSKTETRLPDLTKEAEADKWIGCEMVTSLSFENTGTTQSLCKWCIVTSLVLASTKGLVLKP